MFFSGCGDGAKTPSGPLQYPAAHGKTLSPFGGDDAACKTRLDIIETAMMRQKGVTEALKAANKMEWVRQRNSIHSRAGEIVLHELVYAE